MVAMTGVCEDCKKQTVIYSLKETRLITGNIEKITRKWCTKCLDKNTEALRKGNYK